MQIRLRRVFTPGEAVNDEAKCRMAILTAMETAGAKDKHINLKRMAHDRKWGDKFGDRIVKTVIANLEEMGEIVPKVVETDSGKKKSKSEFKLRNWERKCGENLGDGENGSTGARERINDLQANPVEGDSPFPISITSK